MKIADRITHAWNAFTGKDRMEPFTNSNYYPIHHSFSRRALPKSKFTASVYNRIALDVATTTFSYVKINKENYDEVPMEDIGLHKILNEEANIDQTGFQFIHDIVYSMFDEGSVAVVPVDTTIDPYNSQGFDIKSARVGKIVEWFPDRVKVSLYDENDGRHKDVVVSKKFTAILENPLYAVINGQNPTLNRLLQKMSMVDNMDEILSSGRLDVLIQLPYALKNETRINSAKERISQVATDLKSGSNGIAFIDSTEKVIQLNRPANTQIVENAKMLQEEFYNQLGMTANVLNGTASDTEMRLYYSRTIEPIIRCMVDEFNRKFISKTARSQGHRIVTNRNVFIMTPVEQIASMADSLKRNRIMTSNEIRKLFGLRPHDDPSADVLENPNMPMDAQLPTEETQNENIYAEEDQYEV